MAFDLSKLLEAAGITHRVLGSAPTTFERLVPPDQATRGDLVYLRRPDVSTTGLIASSPARVFLVPREWGEPNEAALIGTGAAVVLVENPRRVVTQVLRQMHPSEDAWPPGVHPTAIVDPGAELDASVSVGPHAIIGRVRIGPDSRVGAFTVIKDDVTIGARVTIREHCLIGGVGFGFVRHEDGTLERMPHVGTVVIEDDVEIFPYSNVDRGTLGATRVGRGTKIDHYVHVGHNSSVGEDCVLTAGIVLCGKSRIGDRVWAGVGAIVKEGVKVGDGATLGLAAVALREVEPGATVVGIPAKPIQRS